MATFSPKKIDLTSINNGLQFENGDGITAEAINAPIEASAFIQSLAENLETIVAGKQDQLVIDTEVTEGSENPVTSGAVYEALQGIEGGGGGGSADGEVEPLPNTLVLRDENGFAEVLTPAISWGQALDENQAHKAVNVETLDSVATELTGQIGGLKLGLTSSTDRIALFSKSGSTQGSVLIAQKTDPQLKIPISSKAVYEALLPLQDHQNEMQADIDFLYTLVEGTVVAHETIEDTFATRTTGGGAAVIDNTPTTVQKVQGSTTAVDGVLVNSTFSGIVSQNADGTKQDTLSISPVELGAFDYIDVENQQLIRQTLSFAVADMKYGWCGVSAFNNSKNYYAMITFSGLPKVYAGQFSSLGVVSNHYKTASVTSITNKKCVALNRTAQDVAIFCFRDDDLLVFNDDGTINNTATVDAFKAHFAEIGLQIAFKPSEVLATNDFACPSSYTAYSGGTETIIGGDEATVTQDYYVKVGG